MATLAPTIRLRGWTRSLASSFLRELALESPSLTMVGARVDHWFTLSEKTLPPASALSSLLQELACQVLANQVLLIMCARARMSWWWWWMFPKCSIFQFELICCVAGFLCYMNTRLPTSNMSLQKVICSQTRVYSCWHIWPYSYSASYFSILSYLTCLVIFVLF